MVAEALAAAALAALGDRDVLARIGGPLGHQAREARVACAALPAAEQRTQRARWSAAVRAPLPPGLRGVDPSWIEAALAEVPARAREALATGAADPAGVWLARWTCAEIPPLPAIDPALAHPRSINEAVRLSGAALARWLGELGADQLAFALGRHAGSAAPVFGDIVVRAADRITRAPRAGELGARRPATRRARVEPGPLALLVIAARALAPHVDALARRQLAHRLPRPIGLAVWRALREHASDPIEDAPTWRALGAPLA